MLPANGHDMSVACDESPKCDPQKTERTRKGEVGQGNSLSTRPNDLHEVKALLASRRRRRCRHGHGHGSDDDADGDGDEYSTSGVPRQNYNNRPRNLNETDDLAITMERPSIEEQGQACSEAGDQESDSDQLPAENQPTNQQRRQSQQQQQQQQQVHQSYQGQPTVQPRLIPSMLRAYHRLFKSFRKVWTGVRFDDEVEAIQIPAPRYQPERIDDLLKRTKFNRDELKVMYQGFKQVCPSGLVDENTFRDIYAQFFPQGDATLYAHYLFMAFDQDHNGTVTFHDFVTGLSALSRGTPKEKLRWTFNLYDINGDGRITRDEMMDIIYSVYSLNADRERADGPDGEDKHPNNSEAPQLHANRVFQKLDLNNDGVVTLDEFVTTCLNDKNVIQSLSILDAVL